jgi:hypothetical protein
MRRAGYKRGRNVTKKETRKEAAPLPTMSFRRRAWLEFQRALDPLAPPKPFKLPRQQ